MTTENLAQLKYPIGQYQAPADIDQDTLSQWITDIELFPARVKETTTGLLSEQLSWIYRPDGWSIRQVVHHCADSHMNAIIRFKLALTEDNPTIRPYLEAKWAVLPDGDNDEIEDSLAILKGLHSRWTKLLKNLDSSALQKTYFHPEHKLTFTLAVTIGSYAWHCNHHFAHIKQALRFKNDFSH